MKHFKLVIILIAMLSAGCVTSNDAEIHGEMKKWHCITLVFDGPSTSETAELNPFLNYRLDVTFSNESETFLVPGFFAADGNAAETGADSGNKWMVRFSPHKTGEWTYSVSFKKGLEIAVADNITGFESAGFMDGVKGSFSVSETD